MSIAVTTHDCLDFDVVELEACAAPSTSVEKHYPIYEVAFRADAWLPNEIAVLRVMFIADETLQEIANRLGRSLSAVRTKVYELGLRRNTSRTWNDLEDEYLVEHYGSVASATIAAMLGRTVAAIYAHANGLGLTEGIPPPWTPWEDAQLSAGYRDGMPVMQLAALIGRPLSGAMTRASGLGLRHKCWNPKWSDDERLLAATLAEQGRSSREIAEEFERRGLTSRTKVGVSTMLKVLGFERSWGGAWLAEEEAALRRIYSVGGSVMQLGVRLGRSRTSMTWKAAELGLAGTHPNAGRGFRQGRDWSDDELRIMTEFYGLAKTKNIAIALERPLGAVYNMAHQLGLDSKYHRDWSRQDDIAIGIAYSAGISMTDLAIALDRDVATVSKRALALKLSFSTRANKASKLRLDTRTRVTLPDILALQDLPKHRWVQSLASPLKKKKGKPAGLGQAPVRRSPERIKILKAPARV